MDLAEQRTRGELQAADDLSLAVEVT